MIIYLDESGDCGLNFDRQKTSRYLVIGLLVFPDGGTSASHKSVINAVKRTFKNKLSKYTGELKGNKLTLSIKKYFLREADPESNWCLYAAVADKASWVKYHPQIGGKVLYDEIAKRLFFQISNVENASSINIVVDCSKNKKEITIFDEAITEALSGRLAKNTLLSIKHRSSHEDPGLQAVDLFCSGINRKYEHADLSWYKEFSDKIAVEITYKF